ncbi:MAG: 5-nitroimidazole antibiotic resistance protein, partial [Anaerotignum sp.]|nr:5-nitroimidazole antibiotic resistance protein [Anaerotignum sp.]
SVIAFGRVHILESEEEKRNALRILAEKYSGDQGAAGIEAEMNKSFANVCMLQFDMEHVTGKEAIELVKMR